MKLDKVYDFTLKVSSKSSLKAIMFTAVGRFILIDDHSKMTKGTQHGINDYI